MAAKLSATQLVEIARTIEICGETFYEAATREATSPRLRKLFAFLRDEESRHRQDVDHLITRPDQDGDGEAVDEDHLEHVKWLAEYRVFPDPEAARALVVAVNDEAALLRHAINFEKETILYFRELRELVAPESQPLIDQLIEEEREHIRMLAAK